MIVSAAIVAKDGTIFGSNQLPYELQVDISKHANNFLYALSIEDDEIELPYIETTSLRYVYRQTEDLYWLLVTHPDSGMFTDIHLLGRFVCAIMEYGGTDTNSSTLTDEQRELFYRHIWRAWDEANECPICTHNNSSPDFWEREFESRLQFLTSIRNGHVEDEDVSYFNGLIAESWAVSAKLLPKWNNARKLGEFSSDSDSICSDESHSQSISEESVIDGCRLKCRLEDIRIELMRMQDPYLRLFARRDLLVGSSFEFSVHRSSAPSIKEFNSDSQDD